MFRNFIESDEIKSFMVLDEKDRAKTIARLAKSKKSFGKMDTGIYVKFMCEYGCALIISK